MINMANILKYGWKLTLVVIASWKLIMVLSHISDALNIYFIVVDIRSLPFINNLKDNIKYNKFAMTFFFKASGRSRGWETCKRVCRWRNQKHFNNNLKMYKQIIFTFLKAFFKIDRYRYIKKTLWCTKRCQENF